MAEDEERDSAVNLDNASAKLSIAASHPTAKTLQELESIFVDINRLTEILLSKAHAACEDATLVAAGIRSSEIEEYIGGVQKVLHCHFSLVKEIFRRLSALENRHEAVPTSARDPVHALPSFDLRKELNSIQEALHGLQRREDLTSSFKKLRHQHFQLEAAVRPFRKEKIRRAQLHGARIARLEEALAKKDQELEQMRMDMAEMKIRMDEIQALGTGLRGFLWL